MGSPINLSKLTILSGKDIQVILGFLEKNPSDHSLVSYLPHALATITQIRKRLGLIFGSVNRTGFEYKEIQLPDNPAEWNWLTFCQHERMEGKIIDKLITEIQGLRTRVEVALTGRTEEVIHQLQKEVQKEQDRATAATVQSAGSEVKLSEVRYQNINLAVVLERVLAAWTPRNPQEERVMKYALTVLEENRIPASHSLKESI